MANEKYNENIYS